MSAPDEAAALVAGVSRRLREIARVGSEEREAVSTAWRALCADAKTLAQFAAKRAPTGMDVVSRAAPDAQPTYTPPSLTLLGTTASNPSCDMNIALLPLLPDLRPADYSVASCMTLGSVLLSLDLGLVC